MRNEQSQTDLGVIKIHKNVLASIAEIAAEEIEGVKAVGLNLRTGILGLITKELGSIIKVDFIKPDEIRMEIPLIIKYGFNIPEVAGKVQENVRNSLERMANISTRDINIKVQRIEK